MCKQSSNKRRAAVPASHPWKRAAFIAAEAKKADAAFKDRDDSGKQHIVSIRARMGVSI